MLRLKSLRHDTKNWRHHALSSADHGFYRFGKTAASDNSPNQSAERLNCDLDEDFLTIKNNSKKYETIKAPNVEKVGAVILVFLPIELL